MTSHAPRQTLSRRTMLTLLGAGLAASTCAGALFGCSGTPEPPKEPEWVSRYDWESVMTNARDHKFYYPAGKLSSRFGIDLSDFEGEVDWEAVAADGVEFALIRVGYRGYTEGGLFDDYRFEENLAGAQRVGIPLGCYFFSTAINEKEAREEAAYVLERLGGASLQYPIAYDEEPVSDPAGRANMLSRTQLTANARAFCEAVEKAGYRAMIYGNQHYFAKLDLEQLAGYPIWYAEYGVDMPTGHIDPDIWQYSAKGQVNGIESGVDLNIEFCV